MKNLIFLDLYCFSHLLHIFKISGTLMMTNFSEFITNCRDGSNRPVCTICHKSFHDRSSAKKHVENIHFPGTYEHSCDICYQSFNTKNKLSLHKNRIHKVDKSDKIQSSNTLFYWKWMILLLHIDDHLLRFVILK